jgi:hypothetical protein
MIEIIYDRCIGLPFTRASINEDLTLDQLRKKIKDQISAIHLVSHFLNFRGNLLTCRRTDDCLILITFDYVSLFTKRKINSMYSISG